MLMYILIALAIIVVLFVVIVAMRPPEFRVERSATMNAPPNVAFDQVNDFRKWQTWSPWENLDPNLKRSYEGPPSGKGSMYSWVGNKQVGEGRMTIMETRPSELIRIKLEFIKPFAATSTAEFNFVPQAAQTNVNWSMQGKNNFMFKAMGMFCSMDKMLGGQFEKGLTDLKSIVESPTAR